MAQRRLASLKASRAQHGVDRFAKYVDDPVAFSIKVLGITPWGRQQEILEAAAAHARISVRSGHKVSKSNSAAIVALWWFATRPGGRVVMTSASGRQVKEILWYELQRVYAGAKIPLGGTMHDAPDSGLVAADGRQILGFSTDKPERMAGFSGANLLYIVDEASGVPEAIFEAIEGNRAGGAHVIMFSNPTQTVGTFYESHTSKRGFWLPIHISSLETPNVVEGRAVIPGLATRAWVEEKREEWGEASPLYQVRVLGNFPTQTENQVIGLGLVEAAAAGYRAPVVEDGPLEVGIDPARFGDDETVVFARRGNFPYPPLVLHSMDGPDVANHAMQLVRELRAPDAESPNGMERPRIKVDVIGIGASVFDTLKRMDDECRAIAVNVSESATDESYSNLRAQVWFSARDWLKEGGMLPPDTKLEAELVAPKFSFDLRNRIKVQSKDEIKKTLKRSPDRADGLCLSVFNPPQAFVGSVNVDWMS